MKSRATNSFGRDSIGLVDIVGNFVGYWFGIIAVLLGLKIVTEDKFSNFLKWINEYNNCSFVKENLPPKDKLTMHLEARLEALIVSE
ncbi:Glutathione transferase [Handroanthus impetiginosus]|uniref:Glutathione transferase n=1 Tax=Handroanthus impetiginosus TaxID=429701 RepID=A0A2G9GSR7_9LAMI|nr:Glutathione transferase [Handroanthus impetiginosus]